MYIHICVCIHIHIHIHIYIYRERERCIHIILCARVYIYIYKYRLLYAFDIYVFTTCVTRPHVRPRGPRQRQGRAQRRGFFAAPARQPPQRLHGQELSRRVAEDEIEIEQCAAERISRKRGRAGELDEGRGDGSVYLSISVSVSISISLSLSLSLWREEAIIRVVVGVPS